MNIHTKLRPLEEMDTDLKIMVSHNKGNHRINLTDTMSQYKTWSHSQKMLCEISRTKIKIKRVLKKIQQTKDKIMQ
jgi:hypothetical protein